MVTAQAPAIPWIWDKTPLIQSANVNGVASSVERPVGARLDLAQVSERVVPNGMNDGPAIAGPSPFNRRVSPTQNPLSNVLDAAEHAHRFTADTRRT